MALGRAGCVHDTLQFQRCDDILALAVSILIIFIQRNHIETGGNHDGTVFLCNDLIFLIVINGTCCTGFGTSSAFSGFELDAVLTVNDWNVWNSLGKGNVDGTSGV